MKWKEVKTLGDLKKRGYEPKSIKEELRLNLREKLSKGESIFDSIHGYEDTVIPDVERALLSKHNILFLGLRGQAKTKLARLMTQLLDEYIPVVAGSELNDDPLNPLSNYAKRLISEKGDETPIEWLHRSDRYIEKLATPDVNVADLIGDVDPIKAANLKLPYSDERVIHFGLIPRAHRSIFVINELPDLQARIQVSLFNILQEGDLQIRGFKYRLPLDIMFAFTANPEDYTNRGSIVTPLKDRIESQILTHYPQDTATAKKITNQEIRKQDHIQDAVFVPEFIEEILEQISFEARSSEWIDEKSGVSARLSISAYENLLSAAERRMLKNGEQKTRIRISDFWGIIPSMTGKLELVYEGEQEGPYQVALGLINLSIKKVFLDHFPNPVKKKSPDPYGVVKEWFGAGNNVNLLNDDSDKQFEKTLDSVIGLKNCLENLKLSDEERYSFKELCLHGLASCQLIEKNIIDTAVQFNDPLAGMLDALED